MHSIVRNAFLGGIMRSVFMGEMDDCLYNLFIDAGTERDNTPKAALKDGIVKEKKIKQTL